MIKDMKALVLHKPGDLRYEAKWPAPEIRDGWILVKTRYAGICGSDLPRIMKTGGYHHPFICGHEFCGTVYDASSSSYTQGQRVAILPLIPCGSCIMCKKEELFHCKNYDFIGSRRDGGFAEFCLVPQENVFRLPNHVEFETGAFIEPILVSVHVLRTAQINSQDSVLVIGAGPIGNLTAQWAQIFGAKRVLITDLREKSLNIARSCGLQAIPSHGAEMKSNGPYSLIVEAAGSNKALETTLEQIDHKGRIVVVGRETGDTVVKRSVFEGFMRKESSIIGCWGYKIKDDEQIVHHTLKKNLLKIQPLISHRFFLSEGVKIVEEMWEKKFFYCKVLFDVGE